MTGVFAGFVLLAVVAAWIAWPLLRGILAESWDDADDYEDVLQQQMLAAQVADAEADRRSGLLSEADYESLMARLQDEIQALQKQSRQSPEVLGLLLGMTLLLGSSRPAAAQLPAETGGQIEGRIVSLEPVRLPSGLDVELHPFRKGQAGPTFHAPVAPDGTFHMQDLLVHPDIRYWFSVALQGTTYRSNVVALTQKDSKATVDIPVFPITDSVAGVSVALDHAMLKVDPTSVDVLELVAVDVPGETGYSGGTDGGVVIPLPAGFDSVEQAEGSLPVLAHPKGVLLAGPLPPGRSSVAFEYRLPSGGAAASFTRTWELPVGRFGIFLEDAGPRLEAAGMTDEGTKQVDSKSYHVHALANVAAGVPVSFAIGNLPAPPRDWRITYAASFGAVLAAIFVIGLRRRP